MADSIEVPTETLEFVMRPRGLPQPADLSLDEYLQKCRDYFKQLAIEALESNALPDRTVGIQCVSKDPNLKADLSYPAILKGKWSQCVNACAGLAHATTYLQQDGVRSSHERARVHGDTSIGNMVVFTDSMNPSLDRPLDFPCNIIECGVAPKQPVVFSDIALASLKRARYPNDDATDTWSFNMPELIAQLEADGGLFLGGNAPEASMHFANSHIFCSMRKAQKDADGSQIEMRDRKSRNFLDNITQDQAYLNHVVAITAHNQIVLCMPQVVQFTSDDHEVAAIFDSGLTVMLGGSEPPSSLELLQIFIVSRSLASFLSSTYGAIRTFENTFRSIVAQEALSMLKHSAGNTLDGMAARSKPVAPDANLLKHVISGAVAYARHQRTAIYQNDNPVKWADLGFSQQSFDHDLNVIFFSHLGADFSFETDGLDDIYVDARFVPLVEELCRNLSKAPRKTKNTIRVTRNTKNGLANIYVCGKASMPNLEKISERVQHLSMLNRESLRTRGIEAVLMLANSMRTNESQIIYALGKSGMQRYKNGKQASRDIKISDELIVQLFNSENVNDSNAIHPIEFEFLNLDILGTVS